MTQQPASTKGHKSAQKGPSLMRTREEEGAQKQMRPDLFTDNTTRENIVRLCQRFLESRVFFPAKQDLQNQIRYEKFEDSNTSFYRFNPDGNYLGNYFYPQ